MKQRVALIATLLALALCLGFLGAVAGFGSAALNESALEEIDVLCRLSANRLDSAAFQHEETFDFMRGVAADTRMVYTIFNQAGETVFTTRPDLVGGLEAHRLEGLDPGPGAVVTYRNVKGPVMPSYLCALTRLDDHYYLCISRPAFTILSTLGPSALWLVLAAVLVAAFVLVLMNMAKNRTDKLVGGVLQVLTEFSEGCFDSRLAPGSGDNIEQAARFNEIIGRIQDRVFSQRTRNHALSAVLNRMQNGILAVDQDMNVLLVTPMGRKLLGITGSCEGLPVEDINISVQLTDVLEQGMRQEGVYTSELRVRYDDGREPRDMRLYISPMRDSNAVTGAVALVEDITQMRKLEQVRNEFAANVSHEMKTPLTSIKGFVETLQEGAVDDPEMARKFLRIIMLEADRLTRLINDILTVSKLESGKHDAPNERIRLDELTQDVSDMLTILASQKEVEIRYKRPAEPVVIMGNLDRVEQMLINLIENAIKYNRQGGTVTASIFTGADTVALSISDTGVGIPEEHIPRLFERFYRADKGRSRSMGGTGLGLSIVKHIVKSLNGTIEVHSKLGEGTEFLVTMPKVAPMEDTPAEEQLNEED
ncbi:MAG: sensor histidine kinase [Candidatus Excrementavichristensenella sp.]|jgi:two-component system phosphate regulon sensor histidine kinase PhoR